MLTFICRICPHTHEENKEKHVTRLASEKQLIIELKEKCGIARVDLPLCSHADVATDKELKKNEIKNPSGILSAESDTDSLATADTVYDTYV